jgi:D-lactate dehydrogenase (cytochrome)
MDLLDLFIGMEGTLGVISEATLSLLPLPSSQEMLCAFLPSEVQILKLLHFLRDGALSLPPVSIEFFDHRALNLLRLMKDQLPSIPPLLPAFQQAICCEFHGEESAVDEAVLAVGAFLQTLGSDDESLWLASTEKEIHQLEAFRHAVPEAVNMQIAERRKKYPKLTKLGTDFSVPNQALEKLMTLYRDDLARTGLEYLIFGHIGDNHLHVNILPRTPEEYRIGQELYLKWAATVVSLDGALSAEHGIGKLKSSLFRQFTPLETQTAMRAIRHLFDPESLLNPGNILD